LVLHAWRKRANAEHARSGLRGRTTAEAAVIDTVEEGKKA